LNGAHFYSWKSDGKIAGVEGGIVAQIKIIIAYFTLSIFSMSKIMVF